MSFNSSTRSLATLRFLSLKNEVARPITRQLKKWFLQNQSFPSTLKHTDCRIVQKSIATILFTKRYLKRHCFKVLTGWKTKTWYLIQTQQHSLQNTRKHEMNFAMKSYPHETTFGTYCFQTCNMLAHIFQVSIHGWQKLNPVYLESPCEINFNLSFNSLWFYNTFLTLEFRSNGVHGINFVKNKLQVHHLTRTLANQDQIFWSALTLSNMPQVSSRRKV